MVQAGPAIDRVGLYLWFSESRQDNALTTSSTTPPDLQGNYTLVRLEGWAWNSPPQSAIAPWPATLLTLWWSASRQDYNTCGSDACVADARDNHYVFVSNLSWAFNGTGAMNMPCKYGMTSIARSDPAFFDNSEFQNAFECLFGEDPCNWLY